MSPGISGTLLLDSEVIDDPYPFYRRLRAEAPVWEIPGTGVFTVSTFELVAEATGRVEDFSSNITCLLYRDDDGLPCRLPFGDSGVQALATADPPTHALHRSTVFPELVAKRMAQLEPDVVDIANGCVTRALASGTVEFMTAIGNVVPITMISRLIGFRDSDLDQLLRAAFDSTAMLGSTLTLDELIELIRRIGEIQAWIADQLSTAAKSQVTISSAPSHAACRRGVQRLRSQRHPAHLAERWRRVHHEPARQRRAHPRRGPGSPTASPPEPRADPDVRRRGAAPGAAVPLPHAFRAQGHHARRCRHSGRRNGPVALGLRQPGLRGVRTTRRGRSRPAAPRHHVAFGRGIHHCVGAPLARIEARIVLTVLLERTSSITLDPERPPRWVNSLMVRRHEPLPVQLVAR